MRKYLLLIFFALFSFSATNAEIRWKLSDDGTLTISGTDMPDYRIFYDTNTGPGQTTAPWYSEREKIKKIVIDDGVTSIGDWAFYYCKGLTSITIPNSVTSIGGSAFTYCESLTSITIPNSVTSIGEGVFFNCYALTSITFEGSTPPRFEEDVFKDVNKSIPVYVPANSIEAYKKALGDYFPETSIRALQH